MPKSHLLVALMVSSLLLQAACGGDGDTGAKTIRVPKELFDTSIPKSVRETKAKSLMVGEFHVVSTRLDAENFIFKEDGTLVETSCLRYGEISERSFRPSAPGKWTVEERRYGNTGTIYYAVLDSNEYREPMMRFIIDRDDGIVRFIDASSPRTALKSGLTTDCS